MKPDDHKGERQGRNQKDMAAPAEPYEPPELSEYGPLKQQVRQATGGDPTPPGPGR